MRSSSESINIAACARRVDIDNRFSLRYYYRIADNILRQADIFRAERNIVDLYVMLLRFSSLVTETIPQHRDYGSSLQSKKAYLRKRLLSALNELEELKPAVQQKVDELNRKRAYKGNEWRNSQQNGSVEWPPVRKQSFPDGAVIRVSQPAARDIVYQGSRTQQFLYSKPVEEQIRKLSLSIPRPKEETLSRHSVLGPNGLHGRWQPPITDKGIQYPRILDLTSVEIPSLQQRENGLKVDEDHGAPKQENSNLEGLLVQNDKSQQSSEPDSLISFEATETASNQKSSAEDPSSLISFETTVTAPPEIIRQPSPLPVLAEVQDLIPALSTEVAGAEYTMETPSPDTLIQAEEPLQLHISTSMMESFMRVAKSNTLKSLETCGVLAGSLKDRKFYVTALIIPKQEATENSCQTTNEEEIFEVQDKRSLFPLGWIHTHPTQSCFMSSIDLHTHYSYQIMLPEAVAIVMAPRDSARNHGIFRLTTPGGMSVIRQCQQRGFHPHVQPPDGGPIYQTCTDVYMNPNLKFDVIDLR